MKSALTRTALAMAIGCAALSVKAVADDRISIGLPARVSVGTFEEGLQVGSRNGTLIAERVHKATIGRKGCAALRQFQNALNSVTARTRPTVSRGSKFTAGFYQGYLNAVREAIKETRIECKVRRFSDGIFPGALIGNVYCAVALEDADALHDITFGNIYDGWSEGRNVRDECDLAFSVVAGDCASGLAAQLLGNAQAVACADID